MAHVVDIFLKLFTPICVRECNMNSFLAPLAVDVLDRMSLN